MEAEGTHAPQHAPQRETAGVVAAMCVQAGVDEFEVGDESGIVAIAVLGAGGRCFEARAHQPSSTR